MFLLPLLSCLLSSLFAGTMVSRMLGMRGSCVVSLVGLTMAFMTGMAIWVEVVFMQCEVTVDLWGAWFELATFQVPWS